jgi:thiamine-phosphate pyrophosphorylase
MQADADIYGLTDSSLSLGRTAVQVVESLLRARVRIIQYREKDKYAGEMLEECRAIRELTRAADACFIVNDHVDIAMLCAADGVHIGQEDLAACDVRQLVGPDMIIGLSTHSPDQAEAAQRLPVDYIGVGPLFPTNTKKDVVAPVTLSYLDWVVANVKLPFVAIGGIKRHNIHEVIRRGAKCCALVSELVGAKDIVARVAEVREAMRGRRG